MPFIAMSTITGERVDITKIQSPRTTLKATEIVCPVCGAAMIVKAGMIIRPHFSHKPGREDCPYAEYASRETPEHRTAKTILRDKLAEWFDEYGIAEPDLEVYIPETIHARNRIADVLFTFPGGWRVAHEVQLAGTTVQEMQERTEDYLNAGIDVFWWFGRDAAKPALLNWSMQTYGFVLDIQIENAGVLDRRVLYESASDGQLDGDALVSGFMAAKSAKSVV